MFVKPKAGVNVRDPDSNLHLPESGAEVPETQFWFRRLADGDVILVESNQIHDSQEQGQ